MTDTTNPQADRRDRYAEAIRENEGWVLDGGQHMIDAVIAVADAEQAVLRTRIAELESSCRDVDRLRRDWVEMRDRAEALDARVQALAAAVLPAPTDRAAILREAAAWFDRYDVDSARELRRMADEAQQPETQARRGDHFEAWLTARRDEWAPETSRGWQTLDETLTAYRLHADTGTPLDEHVCEGPAAVTRPGGEA